MQRSSIRYSPAAIHDLDEIWAYITEELQNADSASDTVNGFMDAIDRLSEFPEMGPTLSSVTDVDGAFRFLLCGNYIAFYHLDADIVSIDRILYEKRDYLHILFNK